LKGGNLDNVIEVNMEPKKAKPKPKPKPQRECMADVESMCEFQE